jgi:serine/threonine protein kinase
MTLVPIISALLRRLLVENSSKRYTIKQIKEHQWFKKNFNRPALGIERLLLVIMQYIRS